MSFRNHTTETSIEDTLTCAWLAPFSLALISQQLLLDSAIRNWVLIPILVVMIFVGLLRHNITQLMNSTPRPQAPDVIRQQRVLTRAAATRAGKPLLPPAAFNARLDWLTGVLGSGAYVKKEEEKKKNVGVQLAAAAFHLFSADVLRSCS